MAAPGFVCRRISEAQRRLCALSAAPVTLRKDGTFHLHGVGYWSQKTAELDKGRGYTARYNPADLAEPVHLYRDAKLVAEGVAQQTRIHGNNDKAAAEKLARDKKNYRKAVKAKVAALTEVFAPDVIKSRVAQAHPELVDKETGGASADVQGHQHDPCRDRPPRARGCRNRRAGSGMGADSVRNTPQSNPMMILKCTRKEFYMPFPALSSPTLDACQEFLELSGFVAFGLSAFCRGEGKRWRA